KLTRSSPHFGLDRVEPIVEKINSHLGRWLQRITLRGKVHHGVVSSPTLQRRMIRGVITRRLRHPQFLPTPRRHPHLDQHRLVKGPEITHADRCTLVFDTDTKRLYVTR